MERKILAIIFAGMFLIIAFVGTGVVDFKNSDDISLSKDFVKSNEKTDVNNIYKNVLEHQNEINNGIIPYFVNLSDPVKIEIEFKDIVEFNCNIREIQKLTTYCAVPPNYLDNPPNILFNQKITSAITYSLIPLGIWKDQWDQEVAIWYRYNLDPNDIVETSYHLEGRLWNLTYEIDPDIVTSFIPNNISGAGYLDDGEMYDIYSNTIQNALSAAIPYIEPNPYWRARLINEYVIDSLAYVDDGTWDDAPTVLINGQGSCSEFSYVFIALCRASGIPARYIGGTVIDSSLVVPDEDTTFHRWTQIYLDPYGWIPVDSNWGEISGNYTKYFGHTSNRLFVTLIGGGDSEFLRWNYHWFDSVSPECELDIQRIATWLNYQKEWPKILKPIGPITGLVGMNLGYEAKTTYDLYPPEQYRWDWGDGTQTGWLGPYDIRETCYASHTWKSSGIYDVKVKAKNKMDFESDWTHPLRVHIVRSEFLLSILDILLRVIDFLPSFEPIITPLIELICM